LAAQPVTAAARSSQAKRGATSVLAVPTDVSTRADLTARRERVVAQFGGVAVLMNNAGIGRNPGKPWENSAAWKALLDVNLWGVIHGVEAFVPAMLASGAPGIVINTGSKQGITSPPGNPAYNMSKAAVKSYTESLAHELLKVCGTRVSTHLLIPGYTFTGMTGGAEKPAAAWTADQVVDFMLERVTAGDFYILCPDNDVSREMDNARMPWAMQELTENGTP